MFQRQSILTSPSDCLENNYVTAIPKIMQLRDISEEQRGRQIKLESSNFENFTIFLKYKTDVW